MKEFNLLSEKHCLITGGSRGLGLAMCIAFAKEGAKIAFTYSNDDEDAEDAKVLISKAGSNPLIFKGSVANINHVQETVKDLYSRWGKIDVLVNNAAINQIIPFALLEEEDWDSLMNINLKGTYLYTRTVLKYMIRHKSGNILNIGSFASERFIESPIHYATSKSAIRGFTESLALEVGKHNIRVNLLSPGLLTEGMSKMVPQGRLKDYIEQNSLYRLGTLEEIAKMACFLVSDKNTFMTGAKVVLDGGL